MNREKTEKRRFGLRRLDKIVLGIIAAMVVATIALAIMQRFGLSLINSSITLYLPVIALLALVAWAAFALIRRIKRRGVMFLVGGLTGLVFMLVLVLGLTYLNFVCYTALPHAYKTIADPSGARQLVVLWRFDDDAEHYEQTIDARKAARLALYPDSEPGLTTDDLCVAFDAYPKALGIFYRSNADVEGKVYLAYTGNVAPMTTIESAAAETAAPAATEAPAAEAEPDEAPAEAVGAEPAATEAAGAAGPTVVNTPHGTMMLEWLDDGNTAHFYVQDAGVAEGGECTVRLGTK